MLQAFEAHCVQLAVQRAGAASNDTQGDWQKERGIGVRVTDINSLISRLVKAVIENKIEAQIDIEPDRISVNIEPWQPAKLSCPFGARTEDK